ncbi:hypothetical protein HXX76_012196 [Chlamydomonas incerta]|uniref:Nephrocystin 3-like N-terminal domain-containing protein n=1 Tax=Chlamydomonas incerta TaxID=51695 RepID=A0A835SLN9_CHLIN|nr:hypothetical protein HXX76_012196 [Chlamydomonas incerta]|eukprot:KAG2427876.1 hypothetical protein HXX76_012196 [Chlamydomonas incerta]
MAPKPTGVDDAPGLTPDGLIRDPGDPVETTRLGITLRGLRRLRRRLEDHFGGPEAFRSVSTADVNFKWVRPVTADRACRLLEAREEVAAEDVAPPAYFISHAWKNSLALLLDYLDSFLAAAADTTAVWIDILAVNQHEKTQQQKHDIGAFSDVVAACGAGTIVVLDIANCNPSTRGWCIFEWAHTLSAHGPDGLHVALTPADRAAIVNTLDVTKAECQFPADKDMILQVVSRQHGSTDTFNHKLRLQLLLEPLSYNVDMRRLLRRAAAAGTCWAFGPVAEWLAEPRATAPRVLCVAAGAGEGKSTISAALCAAAAAAEPESAAATATAAAQELPPLPQLPAGGVSAYHFLKYNDQRRLDPVNIIKSLAFQLAMRVPVLRDVIYHLGHMLPELTDPVKAFQLLLQHPLSYHGRMLHAAKEAADEKAHQAAKAAEAAAAVVSHDEAAAAAAAATEAAAEAAAATEALAQLDLVVLLDGLDEADPLLEQLQLHRREQAAQLQPSTAGGGIQPAAAGSGATAAGSAAAAAVPDVYPTAFGNPALHLLTTLLSQLPTWVRFVVTTRPEAACGQVLPSLERTFKPHGGVRLLRPHQLVAAPASTSRGGGDSSSESDAAGGQGSSAAAKDAASAQDSGGTGPDGGSGGGGGSVMVYATVAAGCLPPGSPAASLAAPSLPDLYRLYGSVFYDAWRRLESDAVRREVQDLLGVVLAAQEPLSHSLLQQMGLGHVIPSLPGYPHLFYVDEHHLHTIHKSLADWMAGGGGGGGGGGSNAGGGGAQVVAAADKGTEQAQQQRFAHPDVLAAHLRLGTALAAARHTAAAAPPYLIKYLIHHLAAAAGSDAAGSIHADLSAPAGAVGDGPRPVAARVDPAVALLDEVLADFKLLELALARGRGPAIAESLGSMRRHTALSNDVLRWLSAHMQALQANPKSVLESAQANCPLISRLYRAAVAAAGTPWVPRLVVPFRPPASDWPAMTARLRQDAGSTDSDCRSIDAVVWSPDCSQVAIAGSFVREQPPNERGGAVHVYDAATCRLRGSLLMPGAGPGPWVTALDWSRDGRLLMSGSSEDQTVRWWDVATGQCGGAVTGGHTGSFTAVRPGSGGSSGSASAAEVRVYTHPPIGAAASEGEQVQYTQLPGVNSDCTDLAFSPDGAMLVAAHAEGVVLLYGGHAPYELLRRLQLPTSPAASAPPQPPPATPPPQHADGSDGMANPHMPSKNTTWGVAFSSDSRFLAVSGRGEGVLSVFDTKRSWHDVAHLTGRTKPGSYVAFSGSSTKVAAGDDTGVVSVYDVAQLYDFAPDGSNPLKSDPASLASLPSPPMSSLARADGPAEPANGAQLPSPAPPPEPLPIPPMTTLQSSSKADGPVGRLQWARAPGAERLACCRDGAVCVYDTALVRTGAGSHEGVPAATRSTLHGYDGAKPFGLKVSPDGKWLATCESGNSIVITNTQTWERAAVVPTECDGLAFVAWSPDGRWLLAGGGRTDERLRVLGRKGGSGNWALVRVLRGREGLFWQTHNGGPLLLAAVSEHMCIRLYNVSASPDDPKGWAELPYTLGNQEFLHSDPVRMAASHDGSVLAVGVAGFAIHFFDGAAPYAHRGSVSVYGQNESLAIHGMAWMRPIIGSYMGSSIRGVGGGGGSSGLRLALAGAMQKNEVIVYQVTNELGWEVRGGGAASPPPSPSPSSPMAGAAAAAASPGGAAGPSAARQPAPAPAAPPLFVRRQCGLRGHTQLLTALAVSPDGRWIVSGSQDKCIRVWDAITGRPAGAPLSGIHEAGVSDLQFAADGSALYSLDLDGRLAVMVPAEQLP